MSYLTRWDSVPVYGFYFKGGGSTPTPMTGQVTLTVTQRVNRVDGRMIFPEGATTVRNIGDHEADPATRDAVRTAFRAADEAALGEAFDPVAWDAWWNVMLTGAVFTSFPASDDPDIVQTGYKVLVEERLPSQAGKSYFIQPQLLHLQAKPPGVNLGLIDVPPGAPTAPAPVYAKGMAGGVASLDEAGKVPLNQLPEDIGGGLDETAVNAIVDETLAPVLVDLEVKVDEADLDTQTAVLVEEEGSETKAALSTTFASKPTTDLGDWALYRRDTSDVSRGVAWTTPSAVISRALGWYIAHEHGEIDYTGATQSTQGVQAAIDAAAVARTSSRGSTVWIGLGLVDVENLAHASGVNIKGASRRGSRLHSTTGSVFAWDTLVTHAAIEDLHISTSATGSHVFDMGTTGGFAISTIRGCYISTNNPDASLWRQHNAASYIDVTVDDNELNRPAGSSVPAWDIVTSLNQCVQSRWTNLRAHGNGTTAAPFFRVECTNGGTWNYGLTFDNITGEMNAGGLVHLYGVNGATLDLVNDYDVAGDYQADVFRFSKGATGRGCQNIYIRGCSRHNGGLAAGVYDIEASESTNRNIIIENCEPIAGTGVFNLNNYGRITGSLRTTGATTAYDEFRGPLNIRPNTTGAALYIGQRGAAGHGLDVFLEGTGAAASRLLRMGRTSDANARVEVSRAGGFMWGPGSTPATGGILLPDAGVLPAATAAERGAMRTVFGAAGVADKTYQCLKSAADTYSWVQVATGP